MQRVTIRLPEQQSTMIDWLVGNGEFSSVSEAIRTAIRDMIDQRTEKIKGRLNLVGEMQKTSPESAMTYLKQTKKGE
ncbi:MAG: hypothetical protein AEth_01432 [Candidatus Argoarchaeum ethanivorans]|uniref:CopG family transcriptional regulator n=1 Tax=Candidatus Argoarchaeum ethanivorans TaxID=2608793 RepID=A0A8B3S117_9EURY|nr:MAG: hypothetical protein AEth_01432 [Candidatus Argoarchaeum ethanivorans]